jgi:hypothetical protein
MLGAGVGYALEAIEQTVMLIYSGPYPYRSFVESRTKWPASS